ncbi:MAG: hypothetical protein M3Q65_00780, partial [Chloroflexota bacterium]|nr:hypothetical protein [Chloroflexota bacterium]
PKTRYLVGTEARIGALVARLPDRLRDRKPRRSRGGRKPEPPGGDRPRSGHAAPRPGRCSA